MSVSLVHYLDVPQGGYYGLFIFTAECIAQCLEHSKCSVKFGVWWERGYRMEKVNVFPSEFLHISLFPVLVSNFDLPRGNFTQVIFSEPQEFLFVCCCYFSIHSNTGAFHISFQMLSSTCSLELHCFQIPDMHNIP